MASALNLDLAVDQYFRNRIDEDCYGTVTLQPLIYIDDLARSSTELKTHFQLKYTFCGHRTLFF